MVMILALRCSPHGPLLISVLSFIKLPSILLEICSGQKCDGQTLGRSDKAATILSPFGGHNMLFVFYNRINNYIFYDK